MATILGSIFGSIFWSDSDQMVVFEEEKWSRRKIMAPKNGPKNGLRKDSKIDHFGNHFRGTKMDQFLVIKNGPTQTKW